jgi:hypothetical protein
MPAMTFAVTAGEGMRPLEPHEDTINPAARTSSARRRQHDAPQTAARLTANDSRRAAAAA